MNTVQTAATTWLDSGIAVIPIAYRDKRPRVPSWREFQDRLPTADEVRRWFASRLTNLAIITGWRGLVVLDFDQRPLYDLWRAWATATAPAVTNSYTVRTSRGVHVYYYIAEPVQTMRAGTIDIKAAGGYVLAPPSIHPSGAAYEVITPAAIMRVDRLADLLPPALLEQPPAPVRPRRVEELPASPWHSAIAPARLTDRTISEIADMHNLLDLFPGAQRRGQRYWTCCPLHNDHNASLSIDADGRRARCWAGCLWGDYIDWYAALNDLTLSAAVAELSC